MHKFTSERLKLKKIHESLIMEGSHKGRINLVTGLYEPYFIADLPFSDEMERVPVIQSDNANSWSNYGKEVSCAMNLISLKINLYVDRFLSFTSSHVPISCQRDISEANFNIWHLALNFQSPESFL